MKILKWLAALVGVLVVSIIVGIYAFLSSTEADYTGEMYLDGVFEPVEVMRDSFGMPHIYAQNDHDAYFALGYCCAQDRIFQMEMMRRAIRGTMSEVLGERLLDVDRLFRTLTVLKPLDEMYAALSPEVKAAMDAYAAGVNHYLGHHREKLPFEFAIMGYRPEPWLPTDELAGIYYMAWALNFSFHAELTHSVIAQKVGDEMAAEIFAAYPADGPTILPTDKFSALSLPLLDVVAKAREVTGLVSRGASNNWVVAGAKSVTGKPLLANDMHLGLILPSVWYEAHLVTPTQNVSGVVIPGVPLVVAGANEHVAWGFTNVMADDADYYLEKINPNDSTQYEFRGEWETMKIRHDTIIVRGNKEPDVLTIRQTRHGVIMNDVIKMEDMPTDPIAMRWTISDFNSEAQAMYQLNRAKNIDDIEEAAKMYKIPGQNWVYADDQGNIGYWAAVGIPIRDDYYSGMLVPGWDGRHEWHGYVPSDEQPHIRNPERGWLASANNKPVNDDYPYTISHYYAPPDRFIRITRMLQEKEKLSIDDFKRMQADQYMVMGERWVPRIEEILAGRELPELQKQALTRLGDWDYVARAESPEPAIFHVFVQSFIETIFKERLGDSLYIHWLSNNFIVHNAINYLIQTDQSDWFDNPATEQIETIDTILATCFAAAVDTLAARFGENIDEWNWGELHSVSFFHPLGRYLPIIGDMMNIDPYPMGGGSQSVNPGLYSLNEPYRTLAGASQRYIFDLSDINNSQRIIPTGESGNFMSDHYDDQVDLWLDVDYRPFHLDREHIEREAAYIMKLIPADSTPGNSQK